MIGYVGGNGALGASGSAGRAKPTKRVASITLTPSGEPDAEAVLGAGTFVIPAMIGLSDTSSRTYLIACDAAGNALERLPYRQAR
jgi:hypothetical protein